MCVSVSVSERVRVSVSVSVSVSLIGWHRKCRSRVVVLCFDHVCSSEYE